MFALWSLRYEKNTPPLDLNSDSPNVQWYKTSNLDKLPVYVLFDGKEKNELNYVKKKRYKNSLRYKQSIQRTQTNKHNNKRESN